MRKLRNREVKYFAQGHVPEVGFEFRQPSSRVLAKPQT